MEVSQTTVNMVTPWCHQDVCLSAPPSSAYGLKVTSRSKIAAVALVITSLFQAAGSRKLEEKFLEILTVLLLTFHWSELSYMFIPTCKGGWEI